MAIRDRNNSLFYRSERGADVGDLYMALIYTAELHRENAFEYLTPCSSTSATSAQIPPAGCRGPTATP